jgi:hypothetical protein
MLNIIEALAIFLVVIFGLYGSMTKTKGEDGRINIKGLITIIGTLCPSVVLFILFLNSAEEKQQLEEHLASNNSEPHLSFSIIYESTNAVHEELKNTYVGDKQKWQYPKNLPPSIANELCGIGAIVFLIESQKLNKVSNFSELKKHAKFIETTTNNCIGNSVVNEISFRQTKNSNDIEMRKDLILKNDVSNFNIFIARGLETLIFFTKKVQSGFEQPFSDHLFGKIVLIDGRWSVCAQPVKKYINEVLYYHFVIPKDISELRRQECEL